VGSSDLGKSGLLTICYKSFGAHGARMDNALRGSCHNPRFAAERGLSPDFEKDPR